jgi:hypothetical protein
MRKGTPASALSGGSQCRLRFRGEPQTKPAADANLLPVESKLV